MANETTRTCLVSAFGIEKTVGGCRRHFPCVVQVRFIREFWWHIEVIDVL